MRTGKGFNHPQRARLLFPGSPVLLGEQQLAVLEAGSPGARKSRAQQWVGPAAPWLDVGTGTDIPKRYCVFGARHPAIK